LSTAGSDIGSDPAPWVHPASNRMTAIIDKIDMSIIFLFIWSPSKVIIYLKKQKSGSFTDYSFPPFSRR
jgi:hypothetical protein